MAAPKLTSFAAATLFSATLLACGRADAAWDTVPQVTITANRDDNPRLARVDSQIVESLKQRYKLLYQE